MKVLVVLGHPSTKSFNHAIADTVVETLKDNGHDVMYHDLYAENFDPVLPYNEISQEASISPVVKKHSDELASADGIIVVHPSWWGQPPAVLKGWIDRVFRPGVAYKFEEGEEPGKAAPVGLLKAENALVINTENTPHDIVKQMFGDTLEDIWNRSILTFCGVKNYNRKVYDQIAISTPEQRKAWLDEVRVTVDQIFPRAGVMRRIA